VTLGLTQQLNQWRQDAKIPQAQLDACWLQTMLTGFPASYLGIAAFAETDVTDDMKTNDVPTLILHGDDDQIAPVGNAALAAALVPESILKIYPGAPHAMTTTHKDEVNQDLLPSSRASNGHSINGVDCRAPTHWWPIALSQMQRAGVSRCR
jgi:pimeloyl-ACP methyl ester carboxylesterase